MKNILEILKENGIELSKEEQEAVNKAVAENYKTVGEFNKKVGKLETEQDSLKQQLEAANETLKGFEGVDADGMKRQLEEYQQKIKDMEAEHKQALYERDFEDVLKSAMEDYKFTSEYAKKSVVEEVKAAGLKLVDGKIIGLNDMIETIKGKDASAFVDEEQTALEKKKAQFTNRLGSSGNHGKLSMAELMRMKNENPDMDISPYMKKE